MKYHFMKSVFFFPCQVIQRGAVGFLDDLPSLMEKWAVALVFPRERNIPGCLRKSALMGFFYV
jgi:hypothetical protein